MSTYYEYFNTVIEISLLFLILNVNLHLYSFIADGYDIVSVVASCSLMMKKEWPLLMPDDKVCFIYFPFFLFF